MSEVLEFYRRWGSARLYCDTVYNEPIGYAAAFFIAAPASWPVLREGFEDWLDDLDEDERAELLPEWCDRCVAIGEIPNSGNYFLLPIEGNERGKVFMFDHDGFEFTERGQNFEEFIKTLCTVNDALLQEIRGHTRYSNGKTAVQWLCQQYLYDEGDT
ncbi:MAG: hypothetical protein DCF32_14600 [Leptolyngbya sp.]|nr:MAG: hypothetical protein DCF32_14600 [Leptolyngbya sp.]